MEEEKLSKVEKQTSFAKKHYETLRFGAIVRMFLFSVPAVVLTGSALWLYFGVEQQTRFIGQFYDNGLNFILLTCIIAAVVCWGIFFWVQVSDHRRRAKLWKESMEMYEALVKSESQFRSEDEKRRAARKSIEEAQKLIE